MEFLSKSNNLPPLPDDVTIPQFILDTQYETRPKRPQGVPWLVADKSGKTIGLDDIHKRTNGLAVGLRDKYHIGQNDVVLIFSSNHIDYPICVWAIHRLLGIVTPCNPSFTVPELTQAIKLPQSTFIIAHSAGLHIVASAAHNSGIPISRVLVLQDQDGQHPLGPGFEEYTTVEALIQRGFQSGEIVPGRKLKKGEAKKRIAFYSSSSGTSGPPKLIKITHYGFVANLIITSAASVIGPLSPRFVPGDRCLAVLPFYHIYGLFTVLHFNFFAAISVVVVPKFNFPEMLRSIDKYKINTLMVVPPHLVLLVKEPIVKKYDLSHVRVVISGAAPLAAEVYHQLIKLIPQAYIGQGYGSTETGGAVFMSPLEPKHGRLNSSGILAPGLRARVVKSDGTLAGYNEEGELYIRSPAISPGYLDNEAATRETFLGDSWLRTGDLVKIDRNEELIVLDRIKEMIKVRGFQVAPAELESCILEHPLIADVCVVGIPHPYSGEVPLVFVTLSLEGRNVSEEKIKASIHKHVTENKAPFKHLHHIEIIGSIPKTPSGKLLRRELRDKARNLIKTKL